MNSSEPSPTHNTSLHIQKAGSGDSESVEWIVARFTPFLRLQAERRLRGPLRAHHDAEDLVNETWLRALPHLQDLEPREGAWTPVLLRYLGTVLLRYVNGLYRRQLKGPQQQLPGKRVDSPSPIDNLSTDATQAVSRAIRCETGDQVQACLESLTEVERETFTQRAMEQVSNRQLAARLNEAESATSMRYHRTLQKLKNCLPAMLLDEVGA